MSHSHTVHLQSTLRSGITVMIRQVVPGDASLLLDSFSELSAESRYLRFLTSKRRITRDDLTFLDVLDSHEHVVWGAFLQTAEGDRAIGVSRYILLRDDPGSVEAGLTVIDPYQNQGVGTLLMGVLYWSALENGIQKITGYISVANHRITRILSDLKAHYYDEGCGVRRVRIAVLEDLEELPPSFTRETLISVIRVLSSPDSSAVYSCDRVPVSMNAGWSRK